MIGEMEHRYCMMHLDRFRQGAGPGQKTGGPRSRGKAFMPEGSFGKRIRSPSKRDAPSAGRILSIFTRFLGIY